MIPLKVAEFPVFDCSLAADTSSVLCSRFLSLSHTGALKLHLHDQRVYVRFRQDQCGGIRISLYCLNSDVAIGSFSSINLSGSS